MSDVWLIVAVVGGVTMLFKSAGALLLGGRELPAPAMRAIRLLGPAVLAALVVVNAVGGDRALVFDERLVGVGVAVIALALKAPALPVVVLAAASTAVVRLIA
ncbi:MAG: AzlD domain-containing protein [Actinomycetota bacterium]